MTKMLGSMTAGDVHDLVRTWEHELSTGAGNDMVMLPKDTMVALFAEMKDLINKKMFFELGRTIQLDETRDTALSKIPSKYTREFEDGVRVKKVEEELLTKCDSCVYKIRNGHLARSVKTTRGNVYFAARIAPAERQNK